MEKYNNFINGRLIDSFGGKHFEKINPGDTIDVIGLFPDSDERDVSSAVSAALEAFGAWSDTPPPQRGEFIYRAAEILRRDKELLAKAIVREVGKTLPEALGDIQSSIDVALFMAGEGRRLYGQTTFSALYRRLALTRRIPIGVCGLITAWNAPMAIITWKLFPALICGNTVVLKPSEDAPLTAYLLGERLKEAGLPEGVVNIVYGQGSRAAESLVKHPDVKLISFTGSSRVGRKISSECGQHMKRCSLEMGGKNGLIILDDADLQAAAKAVAAGAFSSAGQRCAATSRVFVHEKVYKEFLYKLIEETKTMKVGKGEDPTTKVGAIINRRQYQNILSAIEEAKKEGAKCIYGGKAFTDGEYDKGYFIEPTVFVDADSRSRLSQEEIFGPVLAVFKISDFTQAIEKINQVEYGLTASIFTSNINLAMSALEKIQVGCCYVNAPTFGSEPHMPFGGLKNSGNGSREPGTQAMDVFSEWKTIYIDYSSVVQNSQYKMK